jgi:Family of unknown function (DUF5695)
MSNSSHSRPFAIAFLILFLALAARAQVTWTDNFNSSVNYLTNGVAGTMWDGIYLGAGEFPGATGIGAAAGTASTADANITGNNLLTLASLQTDWENTADDGVFLFKVITGDFDMSVQVIGPIDTGIYNFPGLMVRAFGTNGSPLQPTNNGVSENSLLWGRFDEFNLANMLKNNVNGVKTDTGLGTYPNTNYWLRMTKTGATITLYEKAIQAAPWSMVGTATRADFNTGAPLQVGIEHSDYPGGATRAAQFANFSLTANNLGPLAAAPSPPTGLVLAPNGSGSILASWKPGTGSSGSLVAVWPGAGAACKEAPASGLAYSGNAGYGLGASLAGLNCYVVYAGSGTNVAITNLTNGTTYNVAVFAFAGSGVSTAYNHTPAGAASVPAAPAPIITGAAVHGTDVFITNTATPGKWYWTQYSDSLNPANWRPVSPFAVPATGMSMATVHSNGAAPPYRFYRVQQFEAPPEGANLAPDATSLTSYVSPWETLYAINDGFVPANSADHSHGGYGNWPNTGANWVEYDWSTPINVSMMDVYWWQDGGGVFAPASCSVQYWNGSSFVPVSNAVGLGVLLDQYNTTTFSPVTTTRLRLLFQSDAAGHSTGILEWRVYDAGGSPTNWPSVPTNSQFAARVSGGAIVSLQRQSDSYPTEYMAGRLGDVTLRYSQAGGAWQTAQTSSLAGAGAGTFGWNPASTKYQANYQITNGPSAAIALESDLDFSDPTAVAWTLSVTNLTAQPMVIGDLALPLPMNDTYSGITTTPMKHSYIEGYSSFLFWMRPNSVGPYLLMTPADNTKLEYWDGIRNTYEAYIHSYVAGSNAAAQYPGVTTQGARWRQTNTSLTLAPGGSQTYGFKFQWANDYDGIRQALVNEGKIDVHVVPGMTLPTNLFAQIALRTTQTITSVAAEFPSLTQITHLGATNVGTNGTYQLYQVQFSQLGENQLTITYGSNRTTFLEFFVTEPIETLIKKRAAYLVSHQTNDLSLWYNGLYCDENMNDAQLITPDNHDTLGNSFQVYEIASDDAGESRPAYMGAKEAVFPVQSEVTSLDNYINYFVWNTPSATGGLQRTTNETSAYGIYGVPDWNSLRAANNQSLWRGYDYPHIYVMYYGMYQVAKNHPEITTQLSAQEYLRRAWGTAVASWTLGGGQTTTIGLMNELIVPDILDALQAEGMTNEAATLQSYWETKVRYYVDGNANLFASEFSFDATGFESQEAYAKYALKHAGSSALMGSANVPAFLQEVTNFMNTQMTANVFDRGWLETAYYYYGSDYRSDMGDTFVLTYMAQMGGWAVLDYGLNFAPNPADYLRLGYGSILSAWATMNSGPAPNYGFWYPGAMYDGGAGGGFEPAPASTTWLNAQPMHRGPWYYSAEENIGYAGAIRAAATILADDPIFGRFCYGGTWQTTATNLQITPLDGVRRRFHAMFTGGNLHLVVDTDRFVATQPILLKSDLSQVTFTLETGNPAAHTASLHFTASAPGSYAVSGPGGLITTLAVQSGQELVVALPLGAGGGAQTFTITKQ